MKNQTLTTINTYTDPLLNPLLYPFRCPLSLMLIFLIIFLFVNFLLFLMYVLCLLSNSTLFSPYSDILFFLMCLFSVFPLNSILSFSLIPSFYYTFPPLPSAKYLLTFLSFFLPFSASTFSPFIIICQSSLLLFFLSLPFSSSSFSSFY